MEAIIIAAIWAGTFLALGMVLIARFSKPLIQHLETNRLLKEARAKEMLAATQERQNATSLDQLTLEEQAELRKAELRHKTAEQVIAVQVCNATLDDRIAAEQQVIEAKTTARMLAAQQGALVNDSEAGAIMQALVSAYDTYRRTNGSANFDSWLGDRSLEDFLRP